MPNTQQSVGGATGGGLLNVDQAAAHLGISRRTVFQLKKDRRLPFVRIGRQVRFTSEHLDTFIQENTVGAR